ncbi:MAG: nickel pincer cofactor biosynthesis protein LarB [Phycisphaerales bacterium]|nr:nickel pincer cofactor biosynthesis protein LarB [Phycisphaerales bacterium]
MKPESLRQLLEAVRNREMSPNEAMSKLEHLPFEAIDSAKIDHHRAIRCGFPEVIYGEGKTEEDIASIFARLADHGDRALATRASPDQFEAVRRRVPKAVYHERARCITYRATEAKLTEGTIALLAAGTSDLPVIEEARVTCEIMDQRTRSIHDVGVAGVHRLLAQTETLQAARVIVVAAGMEGALPGVVSGLVKAPVIAVPTSVGYGAHFNGLAPLLTMLNTCAAGVAVVNIDSGFAAGYLASMINRLGERMSDERSEPRP